MTTLTITLTAALQTQLNSKGVWLDVLGFAGSQTVVPYQNLFTGGAQQGPFTQPLVLAPISLQQVGGQKIYFFESSGTSDPIPGITSQSGISPTSAFNNNFRYDSFEVSLEGQAGDSGNLSSIVGFGLPMSISANGASVGYRIPGKSIFEAIQKIDPSNTGPKDTLVMAFGQNGTSGGPLTGPRFGTGPASAAEVGGLVTPQNPPFKPADWVPYLQTLAGQTGTIAELAGNFNGAFDGNGIWHNQAFYSYDVTSFAKNGTSYFLFSPDANSQVKGYVVIDLGNLSNSIYAQSGSATVYSTLSDAQNLTNAYTIFNPGTPSALPPMSVGANNQWGELFTQFTTALSGGFLGAPNGKSPNPLGANVDLSKQWNWTPNYAFGQNLVSEPGAGWYSDPYSYIFFRNSNSYGSAYSDNLMSDYNVGGPGLIVGLPGGGDVANIDLTIFGDVETPTGYTPPQLYDYLKAPHGRYEVPYDTTTGDNIKIVAGLGTSTSGQRGLVVDQTKAKISLSILDGYDGGAPKWTVLPMTQASGGTANTLWQEWDISLQGGAFTISPNNNLLPEGTILISGALPVLKNGIGWYQITVGNLDGTATKVFNVYTTTQGGQFVQQVSQQAVDGGANITVAPGGGTGPNVTVNLVSGSLAFVDGSLLKASDSVQSLAPSSPIAGVVSGNVFTPMEQVASGTQTYSSPNVISAVSPTGQVAFGWVGLAYVQPGSGSNGPNGAPVNPTYTIAGGGTWGPTSVGVWNTNNSWDTSYTNKISAGDVAKVVIKNSSAVVQTLTATADIDGQWFTPQLSSANALAAGNYIVTMQEFTDSSLTTSIGPASSPLSLTVAGTSAAALDEAAGATPASLVSGQGAGAVAVANGTSGNDTFSGSGAGDTVVYSRDSKSFALKIAAGSPTITVQDKAAIEGTDSLTGIASIRFHDRTIDAASIAKAASLPVDQMLKVVDLYTAGLDRAPDALGLSYWAGRLADGASLADIAKGIFGSAEAAGRYSAATGNETFVAQVYEAALGRAPDGAGAAYWIGQLQTGHLARTDFVTALIAGARAPGAGTADAQYIANKEAVGAHFALTQGLTNIAWAEVVESRVDGGAASVTAAIAQTDAFAALAAREVGSELVVQIVGLVP